LLQAKRIPTLVFLDLDGVMFYENEVFVEINNAFFGVKITLEEYNADWYLTQWRKPQETEAEFYEKIGHATNGWYKFANDMQAFRKMPAMPSAKEEIVRLQTLGLRFAIITARHKITQKDTIFSLEKKFSGVKFSPILFKEDYELQYATKGQAVSAMGGKLLVDDHPDNTRSAYESGVMGLLLGNRFCASDVAASPDTVYRADDWIQAGQVIESLLLGTGAKTLV
jgi:hypothetical protein